MGAAWTLCVEITFYALLPLYALAAARLRRPWLMLAMLGVGAAVLHTLTIKHGVAQTLPGMFFWFMPGMALAVVSVHRPTVRVPAGLAWAAAAVVFVAVCYLPDRSADLLKPIVALLILAPAVFASESLACRILGLPLLAWLGTISYSIYLYHATVMAWLEHHGAASWPALTVSTLVATVSAAAVSWYALEKPILGLPERRRAPRTVEEPVQVAMQ